MEQTQTNPDVHVSVNSDVENQERKSDQQIQERFECEISWTDLHLAIELPKKKSLTILNGVKGRVKPGELIAILGSSGAGKTTLLNTLAGRIPKSGTAWGSVLVNGQMRDKNTWPYMIGYVQQFELFFNFLTVKETIMLIANLKMKFRKNVGRQEAKKLRKEKMMEIVTELGLNFCLNRKIYEISGGERKRVAIAVELISEPSVLFLDEPTSGLDSFTAATIIQLLQNICKNSNKTILLTIHQPKYETMELFDKIILLSQGKMVYSGTIHDSLIYFEGLNFSVPKNTNPTDFFLDLITIDTRTPEKLEESEKRVKLLQEKWSEYIESIPEATAPNLPVEQNPDAGLRRFSSLGRRMTGYFSSSSQVQKKVSKRNFFPEVGYLFQRNMKENARNIKMLIISAIQFAFLILLIGLVFLQIGNTQQSIQSRAGVLFFMVINAAFVTMAPFLNVFPGEKQIIIRERSSMAYKGYSAFFAKVFSTLPQTIAFFLIYSTILYWMIGLNPDAGAFFTFMLIIISAAVFSVQFGLTIGAIAPNAQIAQALGPTIMLIFVIFGGNFANSQTIPAAIRWIIWISPIQYAYKAAFQNEFEGLTFTCDTNVARCFTTGEQVIEAYDLGSPNKWICIIILWGFIGLFAILGAIILEYTTKPKFILKISPDPPSYLNLGENPPSEGLPKGSSAESQKSNVDIESPVKKENTELKEDKIKSSEVTTIKEEKPVEIVVMNTDNAPQ